MINRKTVAIVQARTGSTRLPGKVTKRIGGKTLVEILIGRLKRSQNLDGIMIATTSRERDDIIADLSEALGIACYRGSEEDVLGRYVEAAKTIDCEIIARITSDNPLTDIELLDRMLDIHREKNVDYTHCSNAPLGVGSEIIGINALAIAHDQARLPYEREHVTPFIRNHPNQFLLLDIDYGLDASGIRLTIDTEDDLQFMRGICDSLGDLENLEARDVVEFLKAKTFIGPTNLWTNQKGTWCL